MGPGAIIGEMGFYLDIPRTATVKCESDCVIYRLSSEAMLKMTTDDSSMAVAFHRTMAKIQSERLMNMDILARELLG